MPFARTFAPVVAGVAEMNYRKFLTFNIVGGIGWVVSMSLLGYFFGADSIVKQHIEKLSWLNHRAVHRTGCSACLEVAKPRQVPQRLQASAASSRSVGAVWPY